MIKLFYLCWFFVLSCASLSAHKSVNQNPDKSAILDAEAKMTANYSAHLNWISFKQLKESLPDHAIVVGLDVDDTVLFSSPGFMYRENNMDGAGGKNKYGKTLKEQRRNPKFWEDMNFKFDQFSMPKQIAYKLMALHKKRGDKIYFITARPPSKKERLSLILAKHFKLAPEKLLYFSNRKTKAPFIKKLKIKLFYGDSDSDITSARKAGVRAIRVLRSPLSTYKTNLFLGKFKEEILKNSAL